MPVAQGGDARPNSAMLAQVAADDGFEGLDFDAYGVFPIISLNQGEFKKSTGGSLGVEFRVRVMSSRPKFLYKTDLPDNDPRGEVIYSYDRVTSTNGTPLEAIMNGWRQKGLPVASGCSNYLEVQGQLEDGTVVLLSIPQTSISAFTAYWTQLKLGGKDIRQVWTRCYKGQEVTRAVKPFIPWAFAVAA